MGPTITLTSLHRLKVPQVSLTTDIGHRMFGTKRDTQSHEQDNQNPARLGMPTIDARCAARAFYEALQAKSAGR
jgi:hypothetical protein